MTLVDQKTRPTSIEGLQALAAIGQRYLMQCWEEAFSKHHYSTAQILLTRDDMTDEKRRSNAMKTLKEIQKLRHVPIINENDTVATDKIRFGDNDRLSSLLAILVEADVLVILSDTNGLYANGNHGVHGDRIKIVERMDGSIFAHVKDKKSSFTVGGMDSKLRAIESSVSSGVPVFLAYGRDKKIISRVFDGEDVGTFFAPHKSRKNWVRDMVTHIRSAEKNRKIKK
jgi:glutamate 5-kinase